MSEAPTPPSSPTKEKKSLTEIFNKFAAEAVERFPHLKGQLLVVDMNEMVAHGSKDIDPKKTGLTKETVLDYVSDHPLTAMLEKDRRMSSLATRDDKQKVNLIYINDSVPKSDLNDVPKETEEHLLFVLDHELAHCAIKDGFSRAAGPRDYAILLSESIADAYAMIRHYQRYGVEHDSTNKYVSPSARADNFILGGDSTHFTSFVLDAIVKRKNSIDFDKLTPDQTAELARRFALEFMPPKRIVEDLNWSFEPVRSEFRKNTNGGIKALIDKTLDPKADYYTFKFGSMWLNHYLADRKLPDGTPIKLPKEYLDNAAKQLKEREIKFAKEDILFNMPTKSPKPPTNGYNSGFYAPKLAA